MSNRALLVVDVQQDFWSGGALEVPDAPAILEPLNRTIERMTAGGAPIFASRDWHPPGHSSFEAQGGPWPVHCVQETPGARFVEGLELPESAHILSKGVEVDGPGYSAFEGTGLAVELRAAGIEELVVVGLATDYCVRASVLDARREGFAVTVLRDAIRAVDVEPGDGARAIAEMEAAGARFITSQELPA